MAETRVVVELTCHDAYDLKKVIYNTGGSGPIPASLRIELEDGTDITGDIEYGTGADGRVYYTFPAPGRYKLFYSWYGSTSIPDYAFREIGYLTREGEEPRIDVPDNFTSVGYQTFANANIECLTLGTGITTVYYESFYWSKLGSFTCKAATQPSNPNQYYSPFRNTYSIGAFYYPQNSDYSGWIAEMPADTPAFPCTPAYMANKSCVSLAPDPPIPSGGTVDSGSTSHTITYSGCPLVFDHSASTGTWNTLPTVTTGGTTNDWWITYDVPANDTDVARTITYYYLRYSGQSCSDLIDTVSYTISQAAGSGTPTPSDAYIRFVDTAITLTGSYVSAALEVSGCTSISDYCTYTGTGAIDFTTIYQFYDSCTINANPNTGSTQLESDLRVAFQDTDGNVYYDTIHVIQPVQVNAYFDPASISVAPGATTASTTAVGLNCTVASVAFDRIYFSGGTWAVDPTFTINGDVVTFQVPENTTNQFRYVIYYFTITDTDGNEYTAQFYLGQYDMRVYLYPYEKEFVASANTKGNNLRVLPSGTTIDSSYTPTYVSSADWLHVDRHMWSELNSGWTIFYGPDRNTTNQTREGYITVNGVHDTYGVVYDGLVCHVTQYSGSYVFANYVSSVSSAETDTTVEIVGVNTNICSVTVSGFTGHPADRWEGFEQPSYTQLGNYITVHIPENDVTGRSRTVQFSAVTIYGESCENTEVLRVIINQAKSGATPTPVQKDIKAADTSYSVGSGSGNASTTVQTTGCTYDHFTYITGGSFSVTATSGPNNTILFYYPENPTTSPRTGYVYITFYDGDGNSYGPQTISFTQQAGSSPGPGPGPDPETGYVLTTLTISDQEQHRYFVEARPGVVYSAAGQYYKTIPACEARYSLYYVNSYGGVDVLPFKGGGQKKTDNITRFNYSRSFRNNTPEFENVNYMNEIKAVWELQTGWIGDDGSSRMHELVESTIVYLYDAEEKTYTPVVMTDKKLEYKTYRNQGRKFYNYTVNVEESQSKERR